MNVGNGELPFRELARLSDAKAELGCVPLSDAVARGQDPVFRDKHRAAV
jgi:hypothetical protein